MRFFFLIVDKRCIVMSLSIPGYRYIFVARWGFLGEFGNHIRKAFVLALAPSRQRDGPAFDLDVHRRIDQREKAVSWAYPRKPWFLSMLDAPEEGLHGRVQAEIDF